MEEERGGKDIQRSEPVLEVKTFCHLDVHGIEIEIPLHLKITPMFGWSYPEAQIATWIARGMESPHNRRGEGRIYVLPWYRPLGVTKTSSEPQRRKNRVARKGKWPPRGTVTTVLTYPEVRLGEQARLVKTVKIQEIGRTMSAVRKREEKVINTGQKKCTWRRR